ncbi:hypothetical protein JB92DRAFT_2825491 [Gautieria morchelliformis]|nr:hypothetical protein JB92DRAFT_2825491 [Gautieria morchelliformis]
MRRRGLVPDLFLASANVCAANRRLGVSYDTLGNTRGLRASVDILPWLSAQTIAAPEVSPLAATPVRIVEPSQHPSDPIHGPRVLAACVAAVGDATPSQGVYVAVAGNARSMSCRRPVEWEFLIHPLFVEHAYPRLAQPGSNGHGWHRSPNISHVWEATTE